MQKYKRNIKNLEYKFGKYYCIFLSKLFGNNILKDRVGARGCYRKVKEIIDKYNYLHIQVQDDKPISFKTPSSLKYLERLSEKTKTYIKNKNYFKDLSFTLHPETITQIPNARVLGEYGLMLTPDNKAVWEISVIDDNAKILKKALWKKPDLIKGNSVLFATNWGDFYYHWIIDVLPKIHLYKKSGLNADYYIFNKIKYQYQKDSIDMLGIDKNKIIETDLESNYKCENLIIPSQPGYMGVCPIWACEFLKNNLKGSTIIKNKRIYISRKNTKQRKVINEEKLIKLLEKYDFQSIQTEDYNLSDQISIFNNAEFIIAPHGGGLTNIVFSNPQTKLIELFSNDYIELCYWRLACANNLDYNCLINENKLPKHGIEVDLKLLESLLLEKVGKND